VKGGDNRRPRARKKKGKNSKKKKTLEEGKIELIHQRMVESGTIPKKTQKKKNLPDDKKKARLTILGRKTS